MTISTNLNKDDRITLTVSKRVNDVIVLETFYALFDKYTYIGDSNEYIHKITVYQVCDIISYIEGTNNYKLFERQFNKNEVHSYKTTWGEPRQFSV